MLFSQRQGFTPDRKPIQLDTIDLELRNRLWNLLTVYFWDFFRERVNSSSREREIWRGFVVQCWHRFFKLPIDGVSNIFDNNIKQLRSRFYKYKWYEVYDFIEFTVHYVPHVASKQATSLQDTINEVLEEENSAYRMIQGKFVPITSETELKAIDEVAQNSEPFPGVRTHILTALTLLSDRQNPDYRNSIKESISAVESVCQAITGEQNATLGFALKQLEKKMGLHTALKSGFSKLYGYTSNTEGIRHALLEEPQLTFSDAKYMLISCSAFSNYLIGKVAELELEIPIKGE